MNSVDTQTPVSTPSLPTKGTKRRFSKLSGNDLDLGMFPGVTTPTPKKVVEGGSYYIYFSIPVTGAIGTAVESGKVHVFASELDAQAQADDVGNVASVTNAGGKIDIVLKINTTGVQTNHGVPASNAFAKLKAYLDGATVLSQGVVADKPASWKAKVNGTTILEGSY